MSTIHTHTFNNGFRVIYEKHYNDMNLTDMRLYVRLGSCHEPPHLRGVSHFIEHMCFKGTKNLPSSRHISTIFDGMGAYLNATTDKQYTYYSVYAHRKNTRKSLQTLGDMLFNSVFDNAEFAKELNVVVEENVKNEANYQIVLEEMMESMIFEGTPYAHPVDTLDYHRGKLRHNLENRDAVFDVYKTYYIPQNMTLSIVSSLSFTTVLDMLKQTLFVKNAKFAAHRPPILNVVPPPHYSPLKKYDLRVHRIPKLGVAYLGIGFAVCSAYERDDVHILEMLSILMSGTFMSRLFYVLREKHGLTYVSNTETYYYESMGAFIVNITSDSVKLLTSGREKGVLPVVVDLLNDLVKQGITAKEHEHTKQFIEGKIAINAEQSDRQCGYNATQLVLLNNDAPTPYNRTYDAVYRKMTVQDVNAAIKKYFTPERMRVCIVGGNLPSERAIADVVDRFGAK